MANFIGLNIKYLCDRNNLSQRDFGDIFGITQAVVNAYIKGKSNPQIDTIQKICNHFKLTIDDFINLDISQQKYRQALLSPSATDEPVANYGDTNSDALIASMRETIETQKALIETLRNQLANAS